MNDYLIQQRGKTWPENAESHGDITSSERPTSPPRGGAALSSGSDWYHKVSVCHLECAKKSISCQCVIAKLGPELVGALRLRGHGSGRRDGACCGKDGVQQMVLALIAPHTFLHCEKPRELREWRMRTGAESLHKSHKPAGGGGLPLSREIRQPPLHVLRPGRRLEGQRDSPGAVHPGEQLSLQGRLHRPHPQVRTRRSAQGRAHHPVPPVPGRKSLLPGTS